MSLFAFERIVSSAVCCCCCCCDYSTDLKLSLRLQHKNMKSKPKWKQKHNKKKTIRREKKTKYSIFTSDSTDRLRDLLYRQTLKIFSFFVVTIFSIFFFIAWNHRFCIKEKESQFQILTFNARAIERMVS